MKHIHILLEDVNLQFLKIRVRPREKKIFELRAANLPKSAACNLPTQAEKKRFGGTAKAPDEADAAGQGGASGERLGRTAWAKA